MRVLLGWWSGGPDQSPGPSLLHNVSLWFVCTLASPCIKQRDEFLLSFTKLSEMSMKGIRWEFTILLQEIYNSVLFFSLPSPNLVLFRCPDQASYYCGFGKLSESVNSY